MIPVIGLILYNEGTRDAALKVLPFLVDLNIVSVVGIVFLYVAGCCCALWLIGFWDPTLLKATVLWTFGSGVVGIFNHVNQRSLDNFFVNGLRTQFGVIVFVEYVATLKSFSFLFELVSLPILTFLAVVQGVASHNKDHAAVENLIMSLFAVFGIYALLSGIYIIWSDPDFWSITTLRDFLLPIILSVAILPLFYLLATYATFQRRFIGIEYKLKSVELQKSAKALAIRNYALDLDGLDRWFHELQIQNIETLSDLKCTFKRVRQRRKIESNPPFISAELGWSPFAAMKFPGHEMLCCKHYRQVWADSQDWCADSEPLKLDESLVGNTLSYRIEGTSVIATRLSVKLNVYNKSEEKLALQCFAEIAENLIQNAGVKSPIDLTKHIQSSKDISFQDQLITLRMARSDWTDLDAYDLSIDLIHKNYDPSY